MMVILSSWPIKIFWVIWTLKVKKKGNTRKKGIHKQNLNVEINESSKEKNTFE
jgi:hypothetical protein